MSTPSSAQTPVPEPGRSLPPGVQVPMQRAEPPALSTPQSDQKNDVLALITLLGGLLLIGGTFMPWMTIMAAFVGTMSRNGLDGGGDGVITLVLGVAALGIGAVRLLSAIPAAVQRIPIFLGLIAGALGIYDLTDVNNRIASLGKNPFGQAYAGSGLYVLLVGAVVTVLGGLMIKQADTR